MKWVRLHDAELERLVSEAERRFLALTPGQQEAHLRAQRDSFVRGQIGMGNDAQELAERAEYRARRHD